MNTSVIEYESVAASAAPMASKGGMSVTYKASVAGVTAAAMRRIGLGSPSAITNVDSTPATPRKATPGSRTRPRTTEGPKPAP